MRLFEKKHFYILDNFFPPALTAGFTKKEIKGSVPADLKQLFPSLAEDRKVGFLRQTHSAKINFVEKGGIYPGDGLFSRSSNLALLVRTADCLPVFFYSKELNYIGILHLGWRSAKKNILGNVIFKFTSAKENLSSFKVALGLGLRSCCYRVGREFLRYPLLNPEIKEKDGRLYFDPASFVKKQLLKAGLKAENFFDLNLCSFCSPEKFFSYRRTRTSLRTISFILKR